MPHFDWLVSGFFQRLSQSTKTQNEFLSCEQTWLLFSTCWSFESCFDRFRGWTFSTFLTRCLRLLPIVGLEGAVVVCLQSCVIWQQVEQPGGFQVVPRCVFHVDLMKLTKSTKYVHEWQEWQPSKKSLLNVVIFLVSKTLKAEFWLFPAKRDLSFVFRCFPKFGSKRPSVLDK